MNYQNKLMTPMVSAIMITGKSPARIPFAITAAKCLWMQTQTNTELIIVNHGQPILPLIAEALADQFRSPGRFVNEFMVDRADLTLGDLRNFGLAAADGDYIIQWDDDDWSHPRRIYEQLDVAIAHDCPVTLQNQLRYDFQTGNGYIAGPGLTGQKLGLPNTVLFPRTNKRYPAISMDEDGCFLRELGYIHAIQNPPEWHIRFSHGDNVCSKKNIMKQYSHGSNRMAMHLKAQNYLLEVVDEHYRFAKGRK
jgi:glycosyltransferase involved in cell wall biosynthesis